MPGPLENQKHERFCQLVAQGSSDVPAYQSVYDCSQDNAISNAWRLKGNEGVISRISELQQVKAVSSVLTMAEKRAFLRSVVKTPVGDITEASELAQSVEPTRFGTKLKMPDKLRALELDAKLAGELDQRTDTGGVVNIQLIQLNLDSGAKPVSISDKNETISVESMPSADGSTFSKKVKS